MSRAKGKRSKYRMGEYKRGFWFVFLLKMRVVSELLSVTSPTRKERRDRVR